MYMLNQKHFLCLSATPFTLFLFDGINCSHKLTKTDVENEMCSYAIICDDLRVQKIGIHEFLNHG